MELLQEIKNLNKNLFDEILEIRRHLHKNPELSFNEIKTSEYICSKLKQVGISYQSGYVKTGIVAKIEGKNPDKKTIALRADMDALPVQEKGDKAYASVNDGVMHACGHDLHSASLLGTAMILEQFKDKFEGTVLFVFQPAEEKLPGGAKAMLEEGIFQNHNVEAVIAQHVQPELESGKTGFKSGMYMASTDEIYLTVKGKGGHAAMPHQITDTVLIASQILVALQQIVSRKANASIPSVLSFGKVIANGATNIIPDEVKVEGTFRTMNEEWRAEAHELIRSIINDIAQSMGATCDLEIRKGYPFLVNDDNITRVARQCSEQFMGKENTTDLDIRMTAEDFSYFTQKYPSSMYRIGVGNQAKGITAPLHSPYFDIDEDVLSYASGLMAYIALEILKE